jgi:hypothetical protein
MGHLHEKVFRHRPTADHATSAIVAFLDIFLS